MFVVQWLVVTIAVLFYNDQVFIAGLCGDLFGQHCASYFNDIRSVLLVNCESRNVFKLLTCS